VRSIDGLLREVVAQHVFWVGGVHALDAYGLLLQRRILRLALRTIAREPRGEFFARLLPLPFEIKRIGKIINMARCRERAEENRHVDLGIVHQHESPVDEIAFGLIHRGMQKEAAMNVAKAALRDYGLAQTADTPAQKLSKGEQVRLAMASLAVLEPDWLVLDESLSSLDGASRGRVLEKVARLVRHGGGALIVSHSKDLAYELGAVRILMEKGGVGVVV